MTATSAHRGRLGLVLAITGAVFVAQVVLPTSAEAPNPTIGMMR